MMICPAKGCDRAIPPNVMVCSKHWMLVPEYLRSEYWKLLHTWIHTPRDRRVRLRRRVDRLRKRIVKTMSTQEVSSPG